MSVRQIAMKTQRLFIKATRKIVFHPGEALLICRMAWWISVLSVAVRVRPLPRALRIVAGSNESFVNDGVFDARVGNQLARAVDQLLSIDMLMFRPSCWKRAAILHRYLLRRGIRSKIVFGVRNDPTGKVSGHAWLEAGGTPVLESQTPEYVITYTFPSSDPCSTELALLSTQD